MTTLAPQFFLPALHGGGAESHVLRILNAWPNERLLPGLWLARSGGSYEKHLRTDVVRPHMRAIRQLGATISVLSCVPTLRTNMRRRKSPMCPVLDFAVLAVDLARRAMPRPDRPPIVILVQNNLSAMLGDLAAPWKYLRSAILRAHRDSDGIVFLSGGVGEDFKKLVPDYEGRTTTISNATWSSELEARSRETCPIERPRNKRVVVACGRLHRQKGFDLLLRAFAQTAARIPSELWLLGEGPERATLEALAVELGIADAVRFLGFQDNPLPFFRTADLFVLASRWEGFGNVVVEALGCGVPVLSTNCSFGPGEILENGRWGRLVPPNDSATLAEGMEEILTTPELASRLAADGPTRARHFEASAIARKYADFLSSFTK